MLEWPEMGKDDEHVDISNHAPTYDVCPIVGPRNDENVENLDCDNDVPMTNPFSFRNMIKDSDVDVMRMLVVYTNSWLVIFMINYGLLVRFIRKCRRHLLIVICSNKIVLWTANRNLFRLLMNNKRLPEMFAQLNHPGEEVFFQRIGAQVVPTHDVAEKVDANLDQSKMFAVRLWQEFSPDVIDFVELYSGDEKMMSMLHNLKKESCGRLEENMRARKTLKKAISLVKAKCFGIVVGYKKTKKGSMQFICTPTRDNDNPSTSNNKGNVGKGKKTRTKRDKPLHPWSPHVSKYRDEVSWSVKTLTDDHKCLQTRDVRLQIGQIFTVVSVDNINGIYPLAYAIVKAESLYRSARLRMAFDPTKLLYYKVVHVERTSSDINIQTYSLDTSNWSLCRDRFNFFSFDHFDSAIYWNDVFHWLETENRQLTYYKLKIKDHDHPIITAIQIPQGRNFFKSYGYMLQMLISIQIPQMLHLEGKLFGSRGCLLLVRRDYLGSKEFIIIEMRKVFYVWSVRYLVNTDDFMTLLPEGWSIWSTVFSIILGEREEDSFLVINLSEKVVKYKLISKTFHDIYDMGSNQLNRNLNEFILPFEVDHNL
nr:hypothetical protein [Tanacetum cinerariifolium]